MATPSDCAVAAAWAPPAPSATATSRAITAASRRVNALTRHVTAAAGAGAGSARRTGPTDGEENLKRERANGTFNVREMTYFLDGSPRITAFKEQAMKELEELRVLRPDDAHDLTRPESRKRVMEKIRALYRLFVADATKGGGMDQRKARLEVASLADPAWFTRQGVHFGLFVGAVHGQGTEEQAQEWLPQAYMLNIFGCFGMTEMGHGSHVRGIETTATYIAESQEFEMHTPTVTATKWWIGGAGQTATHCSVFARLIIDGDDKGVHCFVVQIRDLDTHAPMPGVSVGDCGSKMGRQGIDNGWIQFNHVRIPREQMLQKHAQVAPDGTYTKPEKAAAKYGALLGGRATMVKDSFDTLKAALTIVVRYTCVRRQGEPFREGGKEPQLLDYKSMQTRVLPLLATCYAFHFTQAYMTDLHETFANAVDESGADMLPDVHATSAGLKAYCTWFTLFSLEKLRQCCGGHGYSKYSNLSAMFADFAVQCTWEGDNTVMALQTARYTLSSLKKLDAGEDVRGSVRYLVEALPSTWAVSSAGDVRNSTQQLTALRFQAATLVRRAAKAVDDSKAAGLTDSEAKNNCSVQLLRASKAHVYFNIANWFAEGVEKRSADEEGDPSKAEAHLAPILKTLCDLFVLNYIAEEIGFFLKAGFMTPEHAELVDAEMPRLMEEVRRNAVPLVDAFNLSDTVINSPLGRYDGDVYEDYFERVKAAPLSMATAPYYSTTIKPMFEGADMVAPGGGGDNDDDE